MNAESQITGIERNVPRGVSEEISSWEIINLRHVRGGLRPVGRKPVEITDVTGVSLHVHVMDTVHNLISIEGKTLYFQDIVTGITKQIGDIEGELLDINHLGGVLVVSTTVRKYEFVYDWDNIEYDLFPDLSDIQIKIGIDGEHKQITGSAIEFIISDYNIYSTEKKQEGIMEGFMILRYAIELLDGTYIWPSRPFEIYLHDPNFPDQNGYAYIDLISKNSGALETWAWRGWFSIQFPSDLGSILSNHSNLIAGIAVFGTTPRSWWKPIEESIITDTTAVYAQRTQTNNTPPNIIEKEAFNLIKRYSIDDIVNAGNSVLNVLPNYETLDSQEKLIIEDEKLHQTHHVTSMIYNGRLLTGNITTKLYDGWDLSPQMDTGASTNITALYEFEIKTGFGIKRTHKLVTIPNDSGNLKFLRLISYPDIRATSVKVYYTNGTNWYIVWSGKLIPHPTQNFAYCFYRPDYWPSGHIRDWSGYTISYVRGNPAQIDNIFADPNRVQASETENPLVMPYKNSYQVGNSSILGFAANGEPVSEGQFGQYPVYTFTEEGIYMMDVGVDPFISSVRQINGEVCNSPKTIRNIGIGVLFTTDKGLMIINSLQVNSLSLGFEQESHNDYAVRHNPLYQKAISLVELGQPDRFVSIIPFADYLIGSNIGYDYPNREIWVNNPQYPYSYVFSIDYKAWSKRDETFVTIVDDYPRYYAQQGSNGSNGSNGTLGTDGTLGTNGTDGTLGNVCRNLSAKEGIQNMNIFLLSNPIKIKPDDFKQFRRIVARGEFPVTRMGMYLFGSIDGFSWAYTGGKEIASPDPIIKGQLEQIVSTETFQPTFFHKGKLYFLEGVTNKLYRLENDGTLQLVWDAGNLNIRGDYVMRGQDGNIYFMAQGPNGGIFRLDGNGNVSAVRTVSFAIFNAAAKGQDGRLYFLLNSIPPAIGGVWALNNDGSVTDTNITNIQYTSAKTGPDGKLYFFGGSIAYLENDGIIYGVGGGLNPGRGTAFGRDGRLYIFADDWINSDGIYRRDDDGVVRLVAAGLRVLSSATGPDGKPYIVAQNVSWVDGSFVRGEINLYRLDDDGTFRIIRNGQFILGHSAMSPDGKLYFTYVDSDGGTNVYSIYSVDSAGNVEKTITELTDFKDVKTINGRMYFFGYNDGIWYRDDDGEIKQTNVTSGNFYDAAEYDGKEYFLSEESGIWCRDDDGEIKQTNVTNGKFRFGGVGQDGNAYFMLYGTYNYGVYTTPQGIFRLTGDAVPIIKAKDAIYLGAHKSAKYAALVIAGVATHEWNITHISETTDMVINKKLR